MYVTKKGEEISEDLVKQALSSTFLTYEQISKWEIAAMGLGAFRGVFEWRYGSACSWVQLVKSAGS